MSKLIPEVSASSDPVQLLEAIELLQKDYKGNALNEFLAGKADGNLELIQEFFDLDFFQALVVVPVMNNKLLDKSGINPQKILEWLGGGLRDLVRLNQSLQFLTLRNIITTRMDYDNEKAYTITSKAYRAFMNGRPYRVQEVKEKTVFTFMEKLKMLYKALRYDEIDEWGFEREMSVLLEDYSEDKFLKTINDLELPPTAFTIFLIMASQALLMENSGSNVAKILVHLKFMPADRHKISREIMSGTHPLMKLKLIEFQFSGFSSIDDLCLSNKALDMFLGERPKDFKPDFVPQSGTLIPPSKVQREKLFFNGKEKESLAILQGILSPQGFESFRTRMEEQGLGKGLVILLQGKPGTGKTSTVFQLGAATGRTVFKVDMETINSKWVGDSEKNMVGIFKDYQKLVEQEEQTPIFLLNECDGILKKRMATASSSVDQMNNTLVTLALEQLENFNGILFATVNEANFDDAFERRFLFKIALQTPDEETRGEILQNLFPDLPVALVRELAREFNLTGAQITNIRKKFLVHQLVHPTVQLEDNIRQLCKEEFVLSGDCRPLLGFRRSA
jgi:hypothetical protein